MSEFKRISIITNSDCFEMLFTFDETIEIDNGTNELSFLKDTQNILNSEQVIKNFQPFFDKYKKDKKLKKNFDKTQPKAWEKNKYKN